MGCGWDGEHLGEAPPIAGFHQPVDITNQLADLRLPELLSDEGIGLRGTKEAAGVLDDRFPSGNPHQFDVGQK